MSREPAGEAARNLTIGCFVIFGACFILAFGGLFVQFNVFGVLTGLLVGLSILLSGAADLAIELRRDLVARLRFFRIVTLVFSWVTLVAAVIKDWEALTFFLKG